MHYLLVIIYKFTCNSDFTMIFFCKLSLRWTQLVLYFVFVVRARCHRKKFTFAVSSRDELLVYDSKRSISQYPDI